MSCASGVSAGEFDVCVVAGVLIATSLRGFLQIWLKIFHLQVGRQSIPHSTHSTHLCISGLLLTTPTCLDSLHRGARCLPAVS